MLYERIRDGLFSLVGYNNEEEVSDEDDGIDRKKGKKSTSFIKRIPGGNSKNTRLCIATCVLHFRQAIAPIPYKPPNDRVALVGGMRTRECGVDTVVDFF